MAELQNTIEIEFKPKGDTALLSAIKRLDKATKGLVNAQGSIVKSNAKVGKGATDITTKNRLLNNSFATLRSKMLLASFAGSIFAMTIGKLTKLMGEQELAEKKLETALGKRSNALLAFASAQQKVTTYGDEETITAMSLVGAYTTNEKAIARLTEASMDLASAKGMDLKSAVDLVSKSVFSSTNALSRYGVTIEGSVGSTERLESATKTLSALYGGQAKKQAETFLGSMKQLGNSAGDVGEKFGAVVAPAILLGAKALKAFADSIDAEEIKAYGTALLGVAGTYVLFTKGAGLAKIAMQALNKVSRKNLLLLAGMVAIGAVLDKMDIFKDEGAVDLTKALKDLEGQIGKLSGKQNESLSSLNALELAQAKYADVVISGDDALTVKQSQNQMKRKQMMTELNFGLHMSSEEHAEVFKGQASKEIEWIALLMENFKIEKEIQAQKLNSLKMLNAEFANSVSAIEGAMSAQDEKSKREEIASANSIQNEAKRQSTIDAIGVKYDKKQQDRSKKMKIWKQASALSNTALSVTQVLADETIKPSWLKFPIAGLMIAQGLAQVATIEAQAFAKGGDFVTNKPEMIMVGEAGREHVKITPIDRPESRALKDGGLTINVSAPLVDETILDTIIPAIEKAHRMNLA